VSAIFLKKINKGKIRTANPPLSANVKGFDNSRKIQFGEFLYSVG
jgi:hypothetical protein